MAPSFFSQIIWANAWTNICSSYGSIIRGGLFSTDSYTTLSSWGVDKLIPGCICRGVHRNQRLLEYSCNTKTSSQSENLSINLSRSNSVSSKRRGEYVFDYQPQIPASWPKYSYWKLRSIKDYSINHHLLQRSSLTPPETTLLKYKSQVQYLPTKELVN